MTSKKKKTGLGRGISSLIPDMESYDDKSGTFFMCKIQDIVPNRFQPRTTFKEEELESLKQSIQEQGILQPLLVRHNDNNYELIAGERRLRAAMRAELTHVPALIRDLTDMQMLEVTIIENVQRENLNPLEEAEAYNRLITEFNYTQEMVASRIGKNRSTIANFLRLRALPEIIQNSLSEGQISMGHARTLLGAGAQENQIAAWKQVVSRHLSVRATEKLVQRMKQDAARPAEPPAGREEKKLAGICETLSRRINSPVKIKKKGESGKLEISFKTREDFERLVTLLNSLQ